MIRINLLLALSGITAFVCSCSQMELAGGSTSTPNERVMGTLFFSTGAPAPRTVVQLIPSTYDQIKGIPLSSLPTDTTNDYGDYSFANVAKGTYSVQAVQLDIRTRSLITGIHVDTDTIVVPADTLRVPGTIKLFLPPGINSALGYIYIPGTSYLVFLNNRTDFIILDSVPPNVIPALSYSTIQSTSTTTIRYSVPVNSHDTTVVWNPLWKFSRTLVLNTTVAGADVSGDVTDFPVLVRLESGNFDFSQEKTGGADIRFTKQDNAFLPYEIERWDAINGQAEIWVRVDTVYGSDSMQFITMYWGNIDAPGQSNSVTVFDTASGFQAVWHLGENGDSVFDATGDAFNGKNAGSTPAAGMIGNARNFANGNYIKISGLLNSPAAITLSTWVQSTASNPGQEIISLGDNVLLRLDESYGIGTCGEYHYSVTLDTSFAITKSGRNIANTGWHFIAYSIDMQKNVQALYIDGAQCATSNHADPIKYTGLGKDTYIGIHGNGQTIYNFIGRIDEVRVSNVPLNPDWIKLCFMNQKERDALVKW